VNKAILSRCLVFRFEQLDTPALVAILRQALADERSQLAGWTVPETLLQKIAAGADGDARRALNLLEAVTASLDEGQTAVSEDALERLNLDLLSKYDKNADQHYDIASAMIKSIRANHPDAAVYYLARMIDGGEDPMF